MYHVTTDNGYPYRVCGGQQDSRQCLRAQPQQRRPHHLPRLHAGIEEYGYAAPDPLDPDIVYGGKVTRYDRRTGQVAGRCTQLPALRYRALRTEPLQFSPIDPHDLYFATNTLWLTRDGGKNWKEISPDLSRETFALPAVLDARKDLPPPSPSVAASSTRSAFRRSTSIASGPAPTTA